MKRKCGYIPVSGEKGFTLIELAIVLVIIGIILGAVLKGQDLITAARAKKVINWEKSWETAQWTYLDRKGRFAGDTNRDGIMNASDTTSAVSEIGSANFINAPTESVTVGSFTFYMRMGSVSNRNVIVICKDNTASCGAFATDELPYFEAIDAAIDGYADPAAGNVRGATAVTVASAVASSITEDSTTATWGTSHKGLIYWFDRQHP